MATNNFLPFCATDTGGNLLSQPDYAADAQRPIGNQPGVARSKLVNKALRQATWIASQLAQFISNATGDDVLDNENSGDIQTTMAKAFRKAPTLQKFLSGSGTYTTPANVLYLRVRLIGGGGGGGGSGTGGTGSSGTSGGNTTFGTSLLVGNGGTFGTSNPGTVSPGGTASLGTGPYGIAIDGSDGGGADNTSSASTYMLGGQGTPTPFGGAGANSLADVTSSKANTGSGGPGASGLAVNMVSSNAGGAGGYVDAIIATPLATYAYAVGAGGALGAAGTSGLAGGNGGSGVIIVEEFY